MPTQSLERVKELATQLSTQDRLNLVLHLATMPNSGIEATTHLLTAGRLFLGLPQRQRGGARNVKHQWTDEERECLASTYNVLKPDWQEAKRLALQAQKAERQGLNINWRAQVYSSFPSLPLDLLNRLENPLRGDADVQPSALAITHAKDECGVQADYTVRQLLVIVRKWKRRVLR